MSSSSSPLTIAGRPVGPISYGMMNLTWTPTPPPDSTSFATMTAALSSGATFFNGGEMYGPPGANSAVLLARFLKQHPEHTHKIVLSIKGGVDTSNGYPPKPNSSPDFIRQGVESTLRALDGTITCIDVYQPARIDPTIPIETAMHTFQALVREGKIRSVGLSECSARTIQRATAIHPVEAVEVELSLFTPDVLYNGIATTCAAHGIKLVAFGVLGHGALTDNSPRSNSEIPEGDHRKHLPRFQDGALANNRRLLDELAAVAARKGVTVGQVAIAWVLTLSGAVVDLPPRHAGEEGLKGVKMPVIIPLPGASSPERARENCALVGTLSHEEMDEIWAILARNPVVGERWHESVAGLSEY